jgi:UDP-glucose 4,6-dehydratase
LSVISRIIPLCTPFPMAAALGSRGSSFHDACVLVTGGLGFIGAEVAVLLLRRFSPLRVVLLDKVAPSASFCDRSALLGDPRVRLEAIDLCDRARVEEVVARHRPDFVLHLAAETHVDRSFCNSVEFTRSNVLGTHHLLEACRLVAKPGLRFLFMSTDEVYGDGSSAPSGGHTSAESILAPTNPYSASKAAAEMLCSAYAYSFSLPTVILRCNNVYGPGQHCEKVIPRFILQAAARRPLTIHGGGDQMRSFLYVTDAAAAVLLAVLLAEPGEVIDVGSEDEFAVIELANKISGSNEVRCERDRLFNDLRYPVNTARIRQLGWQPTVSFEEGLRLTKDWYSAHASRCFLPPDIFAAVEGSGHVDDPPLSSGGLVPAAAAVKVLLFGASGWVGGQLVEHMRDAIPARSRLEDTQRMWEELTSVSPTRVVLAAGITGRPNVDWCETNAEHTVRVNVEGAVALARMCARLGIHLTYFGTGCMYAGDDSDRPFQEASEPNFFGSTYSRTKIIAEKAMLAVGGPCLILRLRMPVARDLDHPRNLVAKLRAYDMVVDLPNSVSILHELIPIAVHMLLAAETGVYNFVNPGHVSPADIRAMDDVRRGAGSTFRKASMAELLGRNKIVAGRSNCVLSSAKLQRYCAANHLTIRPATVSLSHLLRPEERGATLHESVSRP